jgi:hypothetical protein
VQKSPIIIQLSSDPEISQEFSEKVGELNRRLSLNDLSYDNWDTLNDRQHDAFVTDLFVDGDSAMNLESYVENGYHNCGCPDVADDLHTHSPVLMRKIQGAKASVGHLGDGTSQPPVQFESMLNEMIDRVMDAGIQEQLDKKPRSLLEFDSPRKLPSKVQAYEDRVLSSLEINGILGDSIPQGDADANGPDAEMAIDGKTYYIEVKLNMNAQMGDKTIKYFPSSGKFQASDKFDDDTKAAIENGMKQIEDDVVNFINFVEDDRYEQSSKWRKQKGADPLGSFATTLKQWRGAIENKLYNKITTGFGKDIEDPVTGDTIPRLRLTMKDDFISQMYASKKLPTYYIQVGGLGLYRLGAANPANLPVPVFKGVISLETRPKPSGGEKELDTEKKKITVNTKKDGSGEDISFLPMYAPERDKDGNIQYRYDKKGNLKMKKIASGKTGRKGEEIPDYEPARSGRDEGKGEFFKVTGAYMGTARFRSPTGDPKDMKKSPYTLDDPESIAAMLAAMSNKDPRAQSGPDQSKVPDLAGFVADKEKK